MERTDKEFPVLLEIKHPVGMHGAYIEGVIEKHDVAAEMQETGLPKSRAVKNIREFSQNEFVLPAGARIKILTIEKRKGHTYIKAGVQK